MGICGHMGVLFEPADEAAAIGAVTGAAEGDDAAWCKSQADFGLNDEDWSEMQSVLLSLAASDPLLAPIGSTLIGNRSIGEGPGTDFFLFHPDELQEMAEAFRHVNGDALDSAITSAFRKHEWGYSEEYRTHLKDRFRQIAAEMNRIAENGWAMIGFLY